MSEKAPNLEPDSPAPGLLPSEPSPGRLARVAAPLKAAAILVYFSVAAIWFPSAVLRTSAISGRATWVGDVIGVAIWLLATAGGLVSLRAAQRRGVI